MLRAQSAFAAGFLLTASVFLFPACSTTSGADAPGCTNGIKDDGEEGVDCGGVCPTKCTGSGCTTGDQCASGKCDNGLCGAPAGKPCGVGVPTQCNDGDKCELDKDCSSGFCDGAKCGQPAAGSHTDGKKNAGETGIDCGGSVKTTQPCPDGQGCIDSTDCVGTCTNQVCGPIGPTDGKKNNGETDIDCGGPNAPKCPAGKDCLVKTDCVDDYCPDGTKKCTVPTYNDGVQNGTETDVDCGGTGPGMKKCPETKACLVDTDCFGGCNYLKKCVDVPSCKGQFGGDTCGIGEFMDAFKNHESCCKSLLVSGYADPVRVGKMVYVDKYEITAGRMRTFINSLAAANGGVPNVKAYMATHRPPRWDVAWEDFLPQNNFGTNVSFTVTNPTPNDDRLLNPGQDQYLANNFTQPSWSVGSGTFQVDTGIYLALGGVHLFPEYITGPGWPTPDYAAAHALNCGNGHGQYGWSTYWFDAATISTYSGGVGKSNSQSLLDEKALNCAPSALFAAFCVWDGGELATAEVMDNITGNTVQPVYTAGVAPQNGLLAPGNSTCGAGGNTLNTFSDGTQGCYNLPNNAGFYGDGPDGDYDDSAKIASPGRVAADVVRKNAADEPWMDMIGNVAEVVLKRGEVRRFDYRGFGVEFGSIIHHKNQQTTPRMKQGALGARCMRFK